MTRVAPFAWTRWYVFEGESRAQMQRVIARELGFRWEQVPKPPSIYSATSLLVFATRTHVVSAVPERHIVMGCLGVGRGRSRKHSRFDVLRSKGAPADRAAGLPAYPPTLVGVTAARTIDAVQSHCLRGFGVLH